MACNPVASPCLSVMANQIITYRKSKTFQNLATWMIIQIDLKGR